MNIDKKQVMQAILDKKNERAVTKATLETMYPEQDWESQLPPSDSDELILIKIFFEEFFRYIQADATSWYSDPVPAKCFSDVDESISTWLNHFQFREALNEINKTVEAKATTEEVNTDVE